MMVLGRNLAPVGWTGFGAMVGLRVLSFSVWASKNHFRYSMCDLTIPDGPGSNAWGPGFGLMRGEGGGVNVR